MSTDILSMDALEAMGCSIHLPLNGDLQDYSGNGNHFTNHGMVYRKCRDGSNVGEFDGTNDYLNKATPNFHISGTDNLSAIAWIRWGGQTDANNGIFESIESDGLPMSNPPYGGSINATTKQFSFIMQDTGNNAHSIASNHVVQQDVWTHVCFVRDYPDWRIYVNGRLDASASDSNFNIYNYTENFEVGSWKRSHNRFFDGNIKDFMFFAETVLTVDEIRALYRATYIE